MKLSTVHPRPAVSAMWRALAVAAAVMLAFTCLAEIAHAAGGEGEGCPQGKLEAQPSPVSPDAAGLPDRFEPRQSTTLAGVVDADRSVIAPSLFARRSAPRAPPAA